MRIPKGIMKIAAVAAKENSRYASNGVHIKRKNGSTIVAQATDGRRAIRVTWKDSDEPPFPGMPADAPIAKFQTIIPASLAMRAGDDLGCGPSPYIHIDEASANGHIAVTSTSPFGMVKIECESIEGKFPPLNEVMPDYEIVKEDGAAKGAKFRAVRIGVNARLLADLLDAMSDAMPQHESIVILEVPLCASRAIKLIHKHSSDERDVVGLMMPVNLA